METTWVHGGFLVFLQVAVFSWSGVRGLRHDGKARELLLFHHSLPWTAAQCACVRRGGHLALMTSEVEERVLDRLGDIWINETSGGWIGVFFNSSDPSSLTDATGQEVTYRPEWRFDPTASLEYERCMRLGFSMNRWTTLNCSLTRPFICQRDLGSCWFETLPQTRWEAGEELGHSTLRDCLRSCQEARQNGTLHCAGVAVGGPNGEDCRGLMIPDVIVLDSDIPTTVDDVKYTLHVRRCYNFSSSTAVDTSDEISVQAEPPVKSCPPFPSSSPAFSSARSASLHATVTSSLASQWRFSLEPASTLFEDTQSLTLPDFRITPEMTSVPPPDTLGNLSPSASVTVSVTLAPSPVSQGSLSLPGSVTPAMTSEFLNVTASIASTTLQDSFSLSSKASNLRCTCRCRASRNPDDVRASMTSLLRDLQVTRVHLSSRRRTLTSAPDTRMSAKAIGVVGVVVIVVVAVVIVLSDLVSFARNVSKPSRSHDCSGDVTDETSKQK